MQAHSSPESLVLERVGFSKQGYWSPVGHSYFRLGPHRQNLPAHCAHYLTEFLFYPHLNPYFEVLLCITGVLGTIAGTLG